MASDTQASWTLDHPSCKVISLKDIHTEREGWPDGVRCEKKLDKEGRRV